MGNDIANLYACLNFTVEECIMITKYENSKSCEKIIESFKEEQTEIDNEYKDFYNWTEKSKYLKTTGLILSVIGFAMMLLILIEKDLEKFLFQWQPLLSTVSFLFVVATYAINRRFH
jgi:hypothetical protein